MAFPAERCEPATVPRTLQPLTGTAPFAVPNLFLCPFSQRPLQSPNYESIRSNKPWPLPAKARVQHTAHCSLSAPPPRPPPASPPCVQPPVSPSPSLGRGDSQPGLQRLPDERGRQSTGPGPGRGRKAGVRASGSVAASCSGHDKALRTGSFKRQKCTVSEFWGHAEAETQGQAGCLPLKPPAESPPCLFSIWWPCGSPRCSLAYSWVTPVWASAVT